MILLAKQSDIHKLLKINGDMPAHSLDMNFSYELESNRVGNSRVQLNEMT